MEARTVALPQGAIRYDAALESPPPAEWFDAAAWRARGATIVPLGGRGSAWSISDSRQEYVLRHYRRGGAVRRLLGDRYWFSGLEVTRAFREFDLLAQLRGEAFRVPQPLATRVHVDLPWYRADLLMRRIPGARTLDHRLNMHAEVDWREVGATVARLHRRGIWHADLNAHNVLIDDDRQVWIVDFDRARLRRRQPAWQRANLERLARSLRKLNHGNRMATGWSQLRLGYREEAS